MALSAKLQQVNNWSVWCDIRWELKQCYISAHWPTNGLQRLILRIPSQQLIMFCHQARTHTRARTHTHIRHTVIIYIYYYTVGLNIMYMPTFKKKHSIGANHVGTQFLFCGPSFFKPVGSQDPCFLCPSSNTVIYNIMSICINSSTPCISPIAKKYSLFLNFTPYFHNCKKLLLSFEFYPLFSRAGGKLLFWKNPSEGSALIFMKCNCSVKHVVNVQGNRFESSSSSHSRYWHDAKPSFWISHLVALLFLTL